MLTINESVHQVTTTHEVTVGGKLGGTVTYERPALLVSLREACGASIGAAGGAATSKQTVPINAGATSLYLAISFEVKRDWARIVPARAKLPFTSVEDRLRRCTRRRSPASARQRLLRRQPRRRSSQGG